MRPSTVAVADHHRIALGPIVLKSKARAAVLDKRVDLGERSGVVEDVEPLAGAQLAAVVLPLHRPGASVHGSVEAAFGHLLEEHVHARAGRFCNHRASVTSSRGEASTPRASDALMLSVGREPVRARAAAASLAQQNQPNERPATPERRLQPRPLIVDRTAAPTPPTLARPRNPVTKPDPPWPLNLVRGIRCLSNVAP